GVVCVVLVVVDVVVLVVVVGGVNVHLSASNAPMSQRATPSQLPSTGRDFPRSSVVIGMLASSLQPLGLPASPAGLDGVSASVSGPLEPFAMSPMGSRPALIGFIAVPTRSCGIVMPLAGLIVQPLPSPTRL